MAELKGWQKNNILCSYFAESEFVYSILDRFFHDLDECYSHKEETMDADGVRDYFQNELTDELMQDLEDWISEDEFLKKDGEADG